MKLDKDDNVSVGTSGIEGEWLVEESKEDLILQVKGEEINVTEDLQNKGHYYSYRDNADVLHRLYIVKNAGGTKDYAERWYSQL